MNLKVFHVVFIAASTLLAAGLGVWCLLLYKEQDGFWTLLSTLGAFVAAVGLVLYGSWFLRKVRPL